MPGPATASSLSSPGDIAFDAAGDLYVGDTENSVVEEITPAGVLSVIAGTGTRGTPIVGPATSSPLDAPTGVAVDPAGDLYIADHSNAEVLRVTPAGVLSVIAGTGRAGLPVPGPAAASPLGYLHSIALDTAGDLYIADYSNSLVEKVTPAGVLSVVAGDGTEATPVPGPATTSPLSVAGIAVDPAGNLYLADYNTDTVDRVDVDGTLSVVAGTGTAGNPTAGPATASTLNSPQGVSVDAASGNLYVADGNNGDIERITPTGTLSVIAGNGTYGIPTYGGSATASGLDYPIDAVTSPGGAVYLVENLHSTIDRLDVVAPTAPTGVTATAGDHSATLTWTAPDNAGGDPVTSSQITPYINGTAQPEVTAPGSATTATVTGLANATAYTFTVTAVTDAGTSPASAPSNPVTPTAPVSVVVGIDRLDVHWHAPADPGRPALSGYRVTVTDHTTDTARVVDVGPVSSIAVAATAGDRDTVTVAAVSAGRTGPDSSASTAAYALPRPSIVGDLAVYRPARARVPILCQVATGFIRSCFITLTTLIGGQQVFIGDGQLLVSGPGAHLRVSVAVTLPPRGRTFAARVGGFTATVHVGMRVTTGQATLVFTQHVRIVAATIHDPDPIRFEAGSATLTAAARTELTTIRHHLGGVRTVVCAGYTDNRGDNPDNRALGVARARATCAYLLTNTGIHPALQTYGKTHPAAPNTTPAGRAANRRTQLTFRY